MDSFETISFESQIFKRWKNFEFTWITHPCQYPSVLDHLHKNFFLSTPLLQNLEYSQEYFDEFDKIYLAVLPQKLSFAVVNADTGEIAGLRITFVQDLELERKFADFNFKTPQMKTMNLVMGTVSKNANIYERFGIDSFVNFYTACVDSKYRGQGLATEMYDEALKFVRSRPDFCYVKSNITSPYTRIICQKFGFTELARVYYKDYKDLLKGAKDDEFVNFMALKLR